MEQGAGKHGARSRELGARELRAKGQAQRVKRISKLRILKTAKG
jgi:hypothetical protein